MDPTKWHPKLKEAYGLLEKHKIEIIEPICSYVKEAGDMKKFNNKMPNPGSEAARKMGCKCPVLDNCHGKGYLVPGSGSFCVSEACPIHGQEGQEKLED
jgi:hypothetical protein